LPRLGVHALDADGPPDARAAHASADPQRHRARRRRAAQIARMDWRDAVRQAVGAARDATICAIAHGHWTDAWLLCDGVRRWFVKTAESRYAPLLQAEADGLVALRATNTVRVPEVVARGTHWLALEWLELHPL